MKTSKETRKFLLFLLLPLSIFIIPLYYWINEKIDERALNKNNQIIIGNVSSSNFRGYTNIVNFSYIFENKIYKTTEFEFNGKKPLPIGLPLFIKVNKNDPDFYSLIRDSLVPYNSGYVSYYKKIIGGWTYEIIEHKDE
jgi:hypothetical protein